MQQKHSGYFTRSIAYEDSQVHDVVLTADININSSRLQGALAHSVVLPLAVLVGVVSLMVLILLHMDTVLLGSILQDHHRLHTYLIFTCMHATTCTVITETNNCKLTALDKVTSLVVTP